MNSIKVKTVPILILLFLIIIIPVPVVKTQESMVVARGSAELENIYAWEGLQSDDRIITE